jgi:hypothetical protein
MVEDMITSLEVAQTLERTPYQLTYLVQAQVSERKKDAFDMSSLRWVLISWSRFLRHDSLQHKIQSYIAQQ